MKTYRPIALTTAILTAVISPLSAEPTNPKDKNDSIEVDTSSSAVRSPLGYEATIVLPAEGEEEEGAISALIVKNQRIIARIANARPLGFNPKGNILLLAEAAADDSAGYLLVDVTRHILTPDYCDRQRIEARYVKSIQWSKDGKTINFISQLSEDDPANIITIDIAEHLKKSDLQAAINMNPQLKAIEQKVLTKELTSSEADITQAKINLEKANTPEQTAAAKLTLEKYTSWHKEVEARLSLLQE